MDKRQSFTISMEQVQREHERLTSGYWFSSGTRRFFDSRWAETATLVGTKAYFVSSDQFHDGGHSEPRKYSVRVCDMATGDIKTVGIFQAYGTGPQARAAINKIVKEAS